jgi:PAS domain S-box-containing protein
MLSFVVILPALSFLALKRAWINHLAMLLLNMSGIMAFFYFIGVYTPFVLLWTIVLVLSYLYSGKIMFVFSSLLLLFETGFMFYAFKDSDKLNDQYTIYLVLSIIVALCTVAVSYAIVRMILNANERNRKLAESQQAEEIQLNRLNTLLNSISDTVLTINRYGRITSQNSAALSFFDTNQTLVGKSIDTVLPVKDEADKTVSVREIAKEMHGTVIRDDIVMRDTSDSTMRLSVQLSPIHGTYGDDDSGCVVIIRDITRQKNLEDEKDEFISVTSHELRTPIAIAEGSLSNLAFMFEKGAKPEQLKASADMAREQVLYLGRMINDLSTLSRAERGVGDAVEEIELNSLLEELYLRYQPEAEAKSLKLDLDLAKLPNVMTSRLYLEEILQNFITNAIKYTKEGTVTLSGKVEDKKVLFSVKDSGIGISKTDQEKIFDKFFRSEDYRTRETNGTGLGLYVVRKLASKLNTQIKVESRLNHGSTFSFSLPASATVADKKSDDTAAS